jgi:histidine phosphotransfer protein HptB
VNNTEHFDMNSLETLREIMEDEFTDLIQLFLTDSGHRLPSMKLAWETRNPVGLRMEAHSFKGSSANVCARYLSNLNMELEDQLRDRVPDEHEWPELKQRINAIESELNLVRDFFSQYLNSPA